MRTRVLIVDDHSGFRGVARLLLEGGDFDVVGEAADGPEAVALADELTPRLVLLDVHLPGADGFAVARQLAALPCAPSCCIMRTPSLTWWRNRLPAIPFMSWRGAVAAGF